MQDSWREGHQGWEGRRGGRGEGGGRRRGDGGDVKVRWRCGEVAVGGEGGRKGGEMDIRMNHGAFPWGEFHFVTAQRW